MEEKPLFIKKINMKNKILLFSVMVSFILGGNIIIQAHGGEKHGDSITTKKNTYPIVKITNTQKLENIQSTFEASGKVLSLNESDIFPKRDGQIISWFVNIGDRVGKGALIARISPDRNSASIPAEIRSLKKQIETLEYKKELTKTNIADTKKIISQQEYNILVAQNKVRSSANSEKVKILESQIKQKKSGIGNSVSDILDAIANIFYNDPSILSRKNGQMTSVQRSLFWRASWNEVTALQPEFLRFYRDFYAEQKLFSDNFKEILPIANKTRFLASKVKKASGTTGDSHMAELIKNLDEAIDHYHALNSDIVDILAEKENLLAETQNFILTEKQAKNTQIGENKKIEAENSIEAIGIDLEIQNKRTEIEKLQGQIGWGTNVYAPFTGIISQRYISIGSSVNPSTPLFRLVGTYKRFVRFSVSEDKYAFLTKGRKISFASHFSPTEKFTGKIARISPSIDEKTSTILVEAEIDLDQDQSRILTNMNVRVEVELFSEDDSENLLAIPEKALNLSGTAKSVWVVNEKIQVEKKEIEVAFILGGKAYISKGLDKKSWVIIETPTKLKNGLEVDTKVLKFN